MGEDYSVCVRALDIAVCYCSSDTQASGKPDVYLPSGGFAFSFSLSIGMYEGLAAR
jgi:hypothetical protein